MGADLPRYGRPREVELFYQGAVKKDLEEVKHQVQRVPLDPDPLSKLYPHSF